MEKNVNEYERYASAIIGGWLAMKGLGRGTFPGLAIAGLGYMLVQRGVTGYCGLYEQMGINTNQPMQMGQDQGKNQGREQGQEQEQSQPAMAQ
jgi:uncharacterized membrane protein